VCSSLDAVGPFPRRHFLRTLWESNRLTIFQTNVCWSYGFNAASTDHCDLL